MSFVICMPAVLITKSSGTYEIYPRFDNRIPTGKVP